MPLFVSTRLNIPLEIAEAVEKEAKDRGLREEAIYIQLLKEAVERLTKV